MAHVEFHSGTPRHPKVFPLSDAAFRLWFNSICFCKELLTNGLLPKKQVPELVRRCKPAVVAELLQIQPGYEHALWEDAGDCYLVHDFTYWNDTRENVQRNREFAKVRQRRHRETQALKAAGAGRPEEPSHEAGRRVSDAVPTALRDSVSHGVSHGVTNALVTQVTRIPDLGSRISDPAQTVTHAPEEVLWETWRELNLQHRVDEAVAMTPSPLEFGYLRKIAARQRPEAWVRRVIEQFLTTEHPPIADKQRTLGYLVSWWAWIEARFREAGLRPEAEAR